MTDTDTIERTQAPQVQLCVKCEQGPKPRGSWSKFHCEPCDIDRQAQFNATHVQAIGDPDVQPLGREHFEAESEKIRARNGWL